MSRKKTVLWLTVLVLLTLSLGFIAGLISYNPLLIWNLRRQYQARQTRFLHNPAPVLATETVDGQAWSLESYRGKVVLLSFWATWCGPCVQELPEMRELFDKYKNSSDFILVGISLDERKDVLTRFCEQRKIEWLQLHEPDKGWDNSLAQAFSVHAIPSVWLIDRDGNIVAFENTLSEIEKKLVELLNPETSESEKAQASKSAGRKQSLNA